MIGLIGDLRVAVWYYGAVFAAFEFDFEWGWFVLGLLGYRLLVVHFEMLGREIGVYYTFDLVGGNGEYTSIWVRGLERECGYID